jgi:hypothetical protein
MWATRKFKFTASRTTTLLPSANEYKQRGTHMNVSPCSFLRLVMPGYHHQQRIHGRVRGTHLWNMRNRHTHTIKRGREEMLYLACERESSGFHKRAVNSLTSWVNFSRNIPNLVVSVFFSRSNGVRQSLGTTAQTAILHKPLMMNGREALVER